MDNIVVRTDLAVEANEEAMNGAGRLKGIRLRESTKSRMGVKVTELQVTNHLGETAIGRPKGTYLTIEADEITGGDEDYAKEVISTLAGYIFKLLKRMNKNVKPEKILVIGLGNRNITSDSLGPEVIDNICININEEGDTGVCTLSPGVMAQTGMECVEILKGIVKETQPELIVTVDALAARNVKRLGRTIQLTDTGITPGSGIGNHRNAINEQSLGLPVISLGVPTVVNAATIVADAMSELIEAEASSCQDLEKLDEQQRQELAQGLLSPKLNELFVTPKNIDESIKQLSFLLSEGLNIALLGNKEENAGI